MKAALFVMKRAAVILLISIAINEHTIPGTFFQINSVRFRDNVLVCTAFYGSINKFPVGLLITWNFQCYIVIV